MWAILYLTGLLRLFFADAASFFFRAKKPADASRIAVDDGQPGKKLKPV
jgi:hypothetical protein